VIENLNLDYNVAVLVGELERVAQEVEEHLEYSPLVSIHRLNQL